MTRGEKDLEGGKFLDFLADGEAEEVNFLGEIGGGRAGQVVLSGLEDLSDGVFRLIVSGEATTLDGFLFDVVELGEGLSGDGGDGVHGMPLANLMNGGDGTGEQHRDFFLGNTLGNEEFKALGDVGILDEAAFIRCRDGGRGDGRFQDFLLIRREELREAGELTRLGAVELHDDGGLDEDGSGGGLGHVRRAFCALGVGYRRVWVCCR